MSFLRSIRVASFLLFSLSKLSFGELEEIKTGAEQLDSTQSVMLPAESKEVPDNTENISPKKPTEQQNSFSSSEVKSSKKNAATTTKKNQKSRPRASFADWITAIATGVLVLLNAIFIFALLKQTKEFASQTKTFADQAKIENRARMAELMQRTILTFSSMNFGKESSWALGEQSSLWDEFNERLMENFSEKISGEPKEELLKTCLLYTSPSPRDQRGSRMPSSA